MQDRFKFRFWNKNLNRFTKGGAVKYGGICFIDTDGEDDIIKLAENQEDYIICQCTGLKDKNGKLIYEGDIIKFTSVYKCSLFENIKEIIFEVVFDNLKYCLNQIKILKGNYSYPYMLDFGEIFKVGDYDYNQTKIKLEVIGNIYENAELLEE